MDKKINLMINPDNPLLIFPEGQDFVNEKIKDLLEEKEKLLKEFREKIKEKLNKVEYLLLIDLYERKLKRIEKEINRLTGYLFPNFSPETNLTPSDIVKAKETSIVETFKEFFPEIQLKKSGKKLTCLCPFHQEKHPSFFLYPETNSFHCFGCGISGDVIEFVKQVKKINFKQAVIFLLKQGGHNGNQRN